MIKPLNIDEQIKGITVLANRGPHTTEEEVEAVFATLGAGDFLDAGVFLGSFDGNAGWERHLKGDELVQIWLAQPPSTSLSTPTSRRSP